MRPVDKWGAGHECRSNETSVVVPEVFNNYRNAKPFLVDNLGCMCSYCENAYSEPRDLQVEHIQPKAFTDTDGKKIYASLENVWTNFLLSCATCNGADNKGVKNVVYGQCHLPHLNNTFLSLQYDAGGVVKVNPSLTGQSKTNAENLLKLVGLDKSPKTSGSGDTRCKTRRKNWNLAHIYLDKYKNNKIDIDTITNLVKGYGGWSIWFTVFAGYDEVRQALIEQFPGTAQNCFDSENHYEPVYRNPNNINDPV